MKPESWKSCWTTDLEKPCVITVSSSLDLVHRSGTKGPGPSAGCRGPAPQRSQFTFHSSFIRLLLNFYVTMLSVEQVYQNIDNKHNRPLATITSLWGHRWIKTEFQGKVMHATVPEVAQSSDQAHVEERIERESGKSKRDSVEALRLKTGLRGNTMPGTAVRLPPVYTHVIRKILLLSSFYRWWKTGPRSSNLSWIT